jgi:uncharacterized protein (DUF1330 family)
MSVYMIIDITVHNSEAYKEYVKLASSFIEKHEGKYLVRGGKTEVREGTWEPGRIIVLEFPSRSEATAFLDDPEYQPIAAIRHAAATTNLVVVEGY